jgi:hypothetical protein
MPLNTEIIRSGETLKLRWGHFHIAAMALAASFDDPECKNSINAPWKVYEGDPVGDPAFWECYPDMPFPISSQVRFWLTDYSALAKTPLNFGAYTLKAKQSFIDVADADHEVLRLLPGDELHAVRGWLWRPDLDGRTVRSTTPTRWSQRMGLSVLSACTASRTTRTCCVRRSLQRCVGLKMKA